MPSEAILTNEPAEIARQMPHSYTHLYPVILCGGSDIRLWPLSRELAPRQLMTVEGENESLLSGVVRKCIPLTPNPICVFTAAGLASEVTSHLVDQGVIAAENLKVLPEPYPCGTTFTLALAASYLLKLDPAAVMLVMPAVHHIADDDRWNLAISRAWKLAVGDQIALMGTTPTSANTSHPLIYPGNDNSDVPGAVDVRRYTLSPTFAESTHAMRGGQMWDTGAFVSKAQIVISEIRNSGRLMGDEERRPLTDSETSRIIDTANFLAAVGEATWTSENAIKVVSSLPNVPFDQCVLQTSRKLSAVPSPLTWSGIATLPELDELGRPEPYGNRTYGKAVHIDTNGSTIFSGADRLVTALGMRDTLIVDTPDALLVAEKHSLPQMSSMVSALREQGAPEVSRPMVRHTPWGTVTTIRREGDFEVNRIQLAPNQNTSPVIEENRASQMTVISGEGSVRLDTHTKTMNPGDSFSVRPGVRTIITNRGNTPYVLIAVVQNNVLGIADEAAQGDGDASRSPAPTQSP